MRWLIALATVIALSLAAALALRTFKPAQPEAVGPVSCPDATLRPTAVLPQTAAAPLQLVVEPSVVLIIDGAEPGSSLLEGEHTLLATSRGQKPAKWKLHVDAFNPVLLEVRASSGAVTVLMVGGRCASCAAAVTDLDLKYRPGTLGDLSGVAKALAEGDWLEAGHMMRGIAPSEREAPEPTRLLAVLYAFVGRPTLVREQLAALDDEALREALTRRDALEELKPVRQLQTATARWNATTERFQRVTDRFVAEAPQPLTVLTRKFGELSTGFGSAQEAKDAIGCEAALEAANAALGESILSLRAMRPADCAWQRRITEAF
ncbi:MAG: hypothetical protein Q8N23_09990 [Archangium sp.]|nr:hypothetical protein [Archangium sp.]MDP3152989.1 hypothetical protein [Archangium sp.]MDP3572623.1 hypothetical protein [Archangium sp.]